MTCASIHVTAVQSRGPGGGFITTITVATHVDYGRVGYMSIGGPMFGHEPGYLPNLLTYTAGIQGKVNAPAMCLGPGLCNGSGDAPENAPVDWNDPNSPWIHRFEYYPQWVGCGAAEEDFIMTSIIGGYQMCDAAGYTGSIVYTFQVSGRFTTADAWVGVDVVGNPCLAYNGVLQPGAPAGCLTPSTSVTPEPSTWSLMVTGLLSLAALSRRRWRQRPS